MFCVNQGPWARRVGRCQLVGAVGLVLKAGSRLPGLRLLRKAMVISTEAEPRLHCNPQSS